MIRMFWFELATGNAQLPRRFERFTRNSMETVCFHKIYAPGILVKFELKKLPILPKLVEHCKVAKFWISFNFYLTRRWGKTNPNFVLVINQLPNSVAKLLLLMLHCVLSTMLQTTNFLKIKRLSKLFLPFSSRQGSLRYGHNLRKE